MRITAAIVEQVEAESLEPAIHRKRELLHRCSGHVHHHPGHFRAHGHAVGTTRDQDAVVRRVDLHVQRRREERQGVLLGSCEDWYQRYGEESGQTHSGRDSR
ncbi:MAG: hypothetical protein DMD48_07610 [Gemmatimonadetes bacterium]|nr:MAG: hypothetical protein DMD48_07610 [Gemmatimonadota bacterium]